MIEHADLVYSFRRSAVAMVDPAPDAAVLTRIDALLADAAESFRARQYDAAIATYEEARRLLWAQLFPGDRLIDSAIVAGRADLYRSLVSASAEWLNVLPVAVPVSGVRGRETPPPLDHAVRGLSAAGLGATGAAAAADLDMATTLSRLGNVRAAEVFRDRATAAAPDLVASLDLRRAELPVVVGAGGPAAPVDRPVDSPIGGPGVLVGPRVDVGLAGGLRDRIAEPIDLASAASVADVLRRADDSVPVVDIPAALTVSQRTWTAPIAGQDVTMSWSAGQALAVDDLLTQVYLARVTTAAIPDLLLAPNGPAEAAMALAHDWYYETPLGLAECHHALGDWETARTWYLTAAAYQYLNAAVEAPYLWGRLAALFRDWGDALFRDGDAAAALPVYTQVLAADLTEPPASPLYALPALAPAATAARAVIASLDDVSGVAASPAISSVILDVKAQLLKISGGLDFWGHWAANVPIWTFDFLQSVSSSLCQSAISAERDAMGFWEKADAGTLTRTQLTSNLSLSIAEQQAAQRQVAAAQAEVAAYDAAVAAADTRAANANASADEYQAKSWDWTMHQALASQLQGGEDGDASELNRLADRMMHGGYSIDGDRGTLAAAEGLAAARMQRGYEIDNLRRQAQDLQAAATQARAERQASGARAAAVAAAAQAAAVRVTGAQQLLAAFDQQRFSPDAWHALGDRMEQISARYLGMALDVAKRMQRAYNFENDTDVAVIRPDYAGQTVAGMLAADALLADISSFTYELVTSTAPKSQPLRTTVSLAQRMPYAFETQFRTTGRLEFSTSLDDFDQRYPGTYAGRIEHVEVAVDGIVPASGISGTLTNSGISHYRVPDSTAVKHRVQSRETLVISDYDPRGDAILTDVDRRRRRIFEGSGVASTWTLEIPPSVNEIDLSTVVDVRLTVSYEARFEPSLRDAVIAELAARPQIHERQRPLPLRWLHPDAFFSFYRDGILAFSMTRSDFALAERDPMVTGVSLVVATTPRARREGIVLDVTAPGRAAIRATTAPDGGVATTDLTGANGASAIGEWRVTVPADANPGWVTGGELDLDAIANIALVLGYSYTPAG